MIQLSNISVSFGASQVLNGIDAVFEEGKTYGIVGENGAGKTTLFRSIAGLQNYKGTISSSLSPLKNHLGLLPSDPYFIPKITGEEHIYLLTNARGKKIEQINKRNIFDLPLKEYASTYSTGMKKKLALLATLLQDNRYYILDEPYNGIDLHSSILLTEILTRLKKMRKTILISSHIFSTLKDTCDEIFLLENGRFVKRALKDEFDELEDEMKEKTLKKNLDYIFIP